ncbi:Uncharacterized protein conserved in bacteria [Legionella steigerwaltii]|uniref:Uncharacterized protein conserved in bacteria n=1 Tax=Legionella steigerwaltii TaxID=460 RepID=A0A378LAI7_9GAMM|nr:DUF1993 domain-containing protein [Legionella steigerwaltii]KTD79153.1 hypothetical protein Lstg_0912 [Legionella steigerwaltii]STY22739.1 Uncharacterized protein conserved in bacteria [Legionella steigerwaltii]
MKQNISMYTASVPVFKQMLTSLNAILEKTQAHIDNNKMDPNVFLQASLFPDMFNFTRQVQIATDFAKGVSARLADMEVPVLEDNEKTFFELRGRIEKTLFFLSKILPEDINGSEEKEIILRPGTPKERKLMGQTYLLHYGIPQFFFHITTAYDILRSLGVAIGKMDYMGTF